MPFAITPQEKTASQSTFYPHFMAVLFASSKLNVTKNWY
jgi:hypothetical protein